MYKKILLAILFCAFCIGSFTFASYSEKTLSLFIGETINLKNYTQKAGINFSSNTLIQNSNTSIISIDKNNNLKALAVGQAVIVFVNDQDLTAIRVNVESPIESITTPNQNITLYLGEIYPLTYEIFPKNNFTGQFDTRLKWTSSKNNIVGLKNNNSLYTYTVGTTTLTGTTFDGSHSISIEVNVIANPNILTIKPDNLDTTIKVGENRQLKAFFDTKNVTHSIEWTSDYPDLMTIDTKGNITPLKAGTCKITAQSSVKTKKDTFTFFIRSMVDNVKLNKKNITFEKPEMTEKLNVTINYETPGVEPLLNGYYFKSSNPSIASVNNEGIITSKKPGIALITVITNDSRKKDTCTVEVLSNNKSTTIDYIPVEEIQLSPYTQTAVIGEKIPLNYTIIPDNATNQSVKFSLKNGELSQIHLIDGEYYFVPEKRGVVNIKIASGDSAEDEIEIHTLSPIASLKLLLDEKSSTGEQKLYIGEQTELFTEILTQGHYSDFDVYPYTLNYTVDDPDVLKLEYINGKYFITALKNGRTSVRVENIEDRHENSIKIKVLSPIKSLTVDRYLYLPTNFFYTPYVTYTPSSSFKNKTDLDIIDSIKLDVETFYFEKQYVEKEIAYEEKIIDIFYTTPYSLERDSIINRHKTRLERLKKLYSNTIDGYCSMKGSNLKDRQFNPYKYYSILGNQISGHYPGKAKLLISLNGTGAKTQSMIHWHSDEQSNPISPSAQWSYYKNILPSNMLNEKVVSTIIQLEYYNVPSSLVNDLEALTTKNELAYVAMFLDDLNKSSTQMNTDNIIYYDVLNNTVKQAIALNYVTPKSSNYFDPSSTVEYKDFKEIVDRIIPNNTLPTSSNDALTHLKLIQLLSQLN